MRTLLLPLVAISCAGGSAAPIESPAKVPPEEHWEAVSDQRFIYTEACATGPFEIRFPAREVEYGRRMVVEVYGPRGVELDNRIDARLTSWGVGMSMLPEGDHARCRADDSGAPVVIEGSPVGPVRGGGGGEPPGTVQRQPPRSGYSTPASELPQLVEYTGELPSIRQGHGAVAWMPKGNPWFYADEHWTAHSVDDGGAATFRFRFWFNRPAHVEGLVFRFIDERLVPDRPLDAYARSFAARVVDSDARRKARQPEVIAEHEALNRRCELSPDDPICVERRRTRGRIPPAPLAETPPKPPSVNVDWTPGYWAWTEDVDDFVWINGAFVVRAPKVVATAPPPPPPSPAPPEAEPASMAPVTITATIDPPPSARPEVIATPPAQPGAIWIAGHWRLRGTTWTWLPGTWSQPPSAGARYRTPSVRVRGNVRVYLPGGWVRLR